MSIPTPADVGLLMTAAEDGFRTFVALCAFAGLRLGEAAAVQLGDVDFVGASLTVTRQVQRINGGAIDVRAPKYGSERVVYLADGLVDLSPTTSRTSARSATSSGCSPARVTSRHQNTVGYWWRKTLRAAGLSDIKLHDLGHFYASGLIAAGCDVTVQRSLGHAKATTTLNTYTHLWPTVEPDLPVVIAILIAQRNGGHVAQRRDHLHRSLAPSPSCHSVTIDIHHRLPGRRHAGSTSAPSRERDEMTARDEILTALPRLRSRLGREDFTPAEVIEELRRDGSVYSDSAIRTHVVSRMCANSPDNHAVVYKDLERVGRGLYRRKDPI